MGLFVLRIVPQGGNETLRPSLPQLPFTLTV